MINAGAIVISSLLKKGMVIADRFDYVRHLLVNCIIVFALTRIHIYMQ